MGNQQNQLKVNLKYYKVEQNYIDDLCFGKGQLYVINRNQNQYVFCQKKQCQFEQEINSVKKRIEDIQNLPNDAIIECYGYNFEKDLPYCGSITQINIFYEYSKQTLHTLINSMEKRTDEQLSKIYSTLLPQLIKLENKDFLLKTIVPSSIFVFDDFKLKIGISYLSNEDQLQIFKRNKMHNNLILAPEEFQPNETNLNKSDVFKFGLSILSFMSNQPVSEFYDIQQDTQDIGINVTLVQNKLESLKEQISSHNFETLKSMLELDYKQRASFKKAYEILNQMQILQNSQEEGKIKVVQNLSIRFKNNLQLSVYQDSPSKVINLNPNNNIETNHVIDLQTINLQKDFNHQSQKNYQYQDKIEYSQAISVIKPPITSIPYNDISFIPTPLITRISQETLLKWRQDAQRDLLEVNYLINQIQFTKISNQIQSSRINFTLIPQVEKYEGKYEGRQERSILKYYQEDLYRDTYQSYSSPIKIYQQSTPQETKEIKQRKEEQDHLINKEIRSSKQQQEDNQITKTIQMMEQTKEDYQVNKKIEKDQNEESEQLKFERKSFNNYQINNNLPYIKKQVLEDGSIYEGQMINGMKQGFGKIIYKNGSYYEGSWWKDKIEGKGTLYYNTGQPAYIGDWKDGKFFGEGNLFNNYQKMQQREFDGKNIDSIYPSWLKYEGQFANDSKEGFGILYFDNGDYFKGQFQNDQANGQGIYTWKNSNQQVGIWKNNVLIQG